MAAQRIQRASSASPWVFLLVLAALAAGFWLGSRQNASPVALANGQSGFQVYFSPNGGATDALVSLIDHANKSVDVQAYSFTSRPLENALISAHQRGVSVHIILDRSHLERRNYRTGGFTPTVSPALEAFYNAGIPTHIEYRYLIAHNKVMLIDGNTIVTGSFNFSVAAEKYNAENMLVIHNVPALFARYDKNFAYHWKTSLPYTPGLVLPDQSRFSYHHHYHKRHEHAW